MDSVVVTSLQNQNIILMRFISKRGSVSAMPDLTFGFQGHQIEMVDSSELKKKDLKMTIHPTFVTKLIPASYFTVLEKHLVLSKTVFHKSLHDFQVRMPLCCILLV